LTAPDVMEGSGRAVTAYNPDFAFPQQRG